MARRSLSVFAGSLAIACLAIVAVSSIAASETKPAPAVPIQIPDGWTRLASWPAIQPVLEWNNGLSWFLLQYAANGPGLNALERIPPVPLDRCGTPVEWRTMQYTASDKSLSSRVEEELIYVFDGVPFRLSADYLRGSPDAVVEHVLNDMCPADIPFARPRRVSTRME